MNINKIQNYTSFKGYENVISNTYQDTIANFRHVSMAMKLNNDDNSEDLKTWQELQKSFLKRENPSDYIVIQLYGNCGKEQLGLEEYILNPRKCHKNDENKMLKTFTLLASLTKRIANTEFTPENKFIYKTLIKLEEILSRHLNPYDAETIATMGVRKIVKHQISAEHINKHIDKTMFKYFKL